MKLIVEKKAAKLPPPPKEVKNVQTTKLKTSLLKMIEKKGK